MKVRSFLARTTRSSWEVRHVNFISNGQSTLMLITMLCVMEANRQPVAVTFSKFRGVGFVDHLFLQRRCPSFPSCSSVHLGPVYMQANPCMHSETNTTSNIIVYSPSAQSPTNSALSCAIPPLINSADTISSLQEREPPLTPDSTPTLYSRTTNSS